MEKVPGQATFNGCFWVYMVFLCCMGSCWHELALQGPLSIQLAAIVNKGKIVSVVDPIIDTSANDGFTEVVSRKIKGKKIANQPKNLFAGLRLHKPKSTFYRPINKQANDKQSKKNTAGNEKASTSQASGDKSTPISNSFSVLNLDEGAACGESVPSSY
ncbi:hypothetical protein Tco_1510049 [Tanacetum coccineum]